MSIMEQSMEDYIKYIADFNKYRNKKNSYLNSGYLCLSSPILPSNTTLNIDWRFAKLFNDLHDNYNIYNATHLMIEASMYESLPTSINNFTKLVTLKVCGGRWFYLTCENMPTSIKLLILVDNVNLNNCFYNDIGRLSLLEELHLDLTFLFHVDFGFPSVNIEDKRLTYYIRGMKGNIEPLPYIEKLKTISLFHRFDQRNIFNSNNCKIIYKHVFFKEYSYRKTMSIKYTIDKMYNIFTISFK